MNDKPNSSATAGVVAIAALLLYLLAIIRNAWISDDAFITLRVVDNFVHGYGLLSNPPERVQGFTNPLWVLLLTVPIAFGIPGYVAAMGTSLLTSTAAAFWITRRAAANSECAGLAALCLLSSEAYVDFSTGGLENPLTHLLLAVFFFRFTVRRFDPRRVYPWLIAALIVINRYDHILLIAPALVVLFIDACTAGRAKEDTANSVRKNRFSRVRSALLPTAIGFIPFVLWFGFTIIYYGFPLPNTAYAKLNAVIPRGDFIMQGLWYFIDSVERDPLTLLVVGLGMVGMVRDRTRLSLATGAGVLVYLCYVVYIGGDFMSGRFFTAPFVVCLIWLIAHGLASTSRSEIAVLAVGFSILGLIFSSSFRTDEKLDCPIKGPSGIVSERLCYTKFTGLKENVRLETYKTHRAYKRGRYFRKDTSPKVVALSSVGMSGYAAGPNVHIIDTVGLTDPLLAHIPYRPKGAFRIGHFERDVPVGYQMTLSTGLNMLTDPCLHEYYDILVRVIRGPLFTLDRWKAIVELNLGRYDYLMRQPCPLGTNTTLFQTGFFK